MALKTLTGGLPIKSVTEGFVNVAKGFRVTSYVTRNVASSSLRIPQETNKTPDGSLGAVGWRRWSSRFGGDASRFLLRPGAAAAAHQIYCGADLR